MRHPSTVWNGLGTVGKVVVLVAVLATAPVSLPLLVVLFVLLER